MPSRRRVARWCMAWWATHASHYLYCSLHSLHCTSLRICILLCRCENSVDRLSSWSFVRGHVWIYSLNIHFDFEYTVLLGKLAIILGDSVLWVIYLANYLLLNWLDVSARNLWSPLAKGPNRPSPLLQWKVSLHKQNIPSPPSLVNPRVHFSHCS